MSTIASPREFSTPTTRRVSPNPPASTSSSARPSLETSRSAATSPNPSSLSFPAGPSSPQPQPQPPPPQLQGLGGGPGKRANRAALREYYNLRKASSSSAPGTPTLEVEHVGGDAGLFGSEVPTGEWDAKGFVGEEFVRRALEGCGLEELLRTYARVVAEIRALDGEKKALVYDNYSKLITATETIRKMRDNMDPLNPMTATLDPAITGIYAQASALRETLRKEVPRPEGTLEEEAAVRERRANARKAARAALELPDRLRALKQDGKEDEARKLWSVGRRLLERWKREGVGGREVEELIKEGDDIVGDEESESD